MLKHRYIVLTTVILNLIIDPLFILDMDIFCFWYQGAAIATIITQFISAIADVLYVNKNIRYGFISELKADFL